MNNKRSQRLKPISRVTQHQERDAARLLGDSRKNLEDQKVKLHELIHYRAEYVGRFQESGRQGCGAVRLQEFQVFLQKLDKALVQQRHLIEKAESDVAIKMRDWLQRRGRHKIMDEVISRYANAEKRDVLRKEQAESDDRNQRKK